MTWITSAVVATAAGNLRSAKTAIETAAAAHGDTVTACRSALELLARSWGGELPNACERQLATYLDGVAAATDAAGDACDTLSAWATQADTLSLDLADAERFLNSTNEAISRAGPEPALLADRTNARWRLAELRAEWTRICGSRSLALDPSIAALNGHADTVFAPPPGCSESTPGAHITELAAWAAANGMSLHRFGLTAADIRAAAELLAGTDDPAAVIAALEPAAALVYWSLLTTGEQDAAIDEHPAAVAVYVLAAGGTLTLEQLERLDLADVEFDTDDEGERAAFNSLQALLAHPLAFLGLAALETANGGQSFNEADGHLSGDDQDDALDPARIAELVRQGAEASGIELTDAEVAEIVSLAVGANALALAADAREPLEDAVASSFSEAPEISDEAVAALEEEILGAAQNFDGFGICAEASGSVGPRGGEIGTCLISTDENFGQVAWYGFGVSGTGGGASAGGGMIATNAQDVRDLGGPAICFTGGAAGTGGGASGTVCGGLASTEDGGYRFNGIITVQGSVNAATPGATVTASVVDTRVVWHNGVVNAIVRKPVEAVVESDAAPWNWAEGILKMDRYFRFGGR